VDLRIFKETFKKGDTMKITRIYIHSLSWLIIIMLVIPPVIMAQDYEEAVEPPKFTKEELTQMLAPIALYPDSLLSDILMASTYPIEVVEAERWLKENQNLKGDDLDKALQEKTWDSSVKSLCYFPDVLNAMSDKLDQTTKLGDAFLSQQEDVMNTVQELRSKAQEQGNLKTTKEQKVIVEKDVIQVEPADPAVIYVPVYNPLYVYGPWWYPAYPPYYWYYPPGFVITGGYIGFGPGIFFGFGLFSWSWFDWHHHHIYIDSHKTRRFNRFDRGKRDYDRHVWRHKPDHRRGVAYRDRATSQRFGQAPSRRPVLSPEARGYEGRSFQVQPRKPLSGTIEKQRGPGTTGRTIERQRGPDTTGGTVERPAIQRPETVKKPQTIQRSKTGQRPQSRSNAFSGVGNWKFERKASERGFTSRQSSGFRSGSGSRSGGQRGGFSGRGQSGGSRR
jgi:hypothetical protein